MAERQAMQKQRPAEQGRGLPEAGGRPAAAAGGRPPALVAADAAQMRWGGVHRCGGGRVAGMAGPKAAPGGSGAPARRPLRDRQERKARKDRARLAGN